MKYNCSVPLSKEELEILNTLVGECSMSEYAAKIIKEHLIKPFNKARAVAVCKFCGSTCYNDWHSCPGCGGSYE